MDTSAGWATRTGMFQEDGDTMARKALLIGAQTTGLRGVDCDLTTMGQALTDRGFHTTVCRAGDATRAGILEAYERLTTDARSDDAVFLYYSGHGGWGRPLGHARMAQPPVALQFIVPTDYSVTTSEDFRGITSIELSLRLARLTAKTRNVTVAFDCCHAAQMSRDGGLMPDSDPQPKALALTVPYEVMEQHLRQTGVPVEQWNPLGNRYAVRVMACAPDQAAYEHTNRDGERVGVFTEALSQALAEAGSLSVTWATVIDRVRHRVLDQMPSQRPDVEGPSRRRLFELTEADAIGTLRAVAVNGRVQLDGGPLLGVQVGDEFAILPTDASYPDTDHQLAEVRIDQLDAMTAYGPLRYTANVGSLPLGAMAHRTSSSVPPFVVKLPAAGEAAAALARAVAESTQLRAAGPDEHCPVEVRFDGCELTVWDQIGPLSEPRPADPHGVHDVVRALKRLSHVDMLRGLTESTAHALPATFTIDFGEVTSDGPVSRPSTGEVLYVGQRIYVRFRNNGDSPVYVALFDLGVLAKVTLLTQFARSGVLVGPGQHYEFGWNELTGTMDGAPLAWPGGGASPQPRPESILVVVTSELQDLGVFEQDGIRGAAKGYLRSPLERIFEQIAERTTRDLRAEVGGGLRYAVRRIDFTLVPELAEERLPFEVDDRPAPSMLLVTPKGATPMDLALRVSDVIIHRNRALGTADIRLDALVVTRAPNGQLAYSARTERIKNIHDDEELPLDRLQIFHGHAIDYLDVAVWVSRDSRGSLELSELLRHDLTDPVTQSALTMLGGLFLAGPAAATAAGAIGAGAVVITAAYRLLRGVAGNSIGLYRTTLLAQERFGLDRPPAQRQVRAQDFSFRYTVDDLSDRAVGAIERCRSGGVGVPQ